MNVNPTPTQQYASSLDAPLRFWLYNLLVSPLTPVDDPITARRLQWFVLTQLGLLILGPFAVLFYVYAVPPGTAIESPAFRIYPIVLVINLFLYLLSRTRYYNIALQGSLVLLSLCFFAVAVPTVGDSNVNILPYLVVPITLAGLRYGVRGVLWTTGYNIVLVILFALAFDEWSLAAILRGIVTFLVIYMFVLLMLIIATEDIRDYRRSRLPKLLPDFGGSPYGADALRIYALQQAVVSELGQRALQEYKQDEGALIKECLTLMSQVLGVDRSHLLEFTEDRQHLRLAYTVGTTLAMPDVLPLSAEHPLAALAFRVSQANEPLIIPDCAKEFAFEGAPPAHSALGVIIYGIQRPFGVLEVYSQQPRDFHAEDISFVQSVANIIGASIERRRTTRAAYEQRAFAEALSSTANILNSTLKLEAVLDRVLEQLSKLLDFDTASIMLANDGYLEIARQMGFEKFGVKEADMGLFRFDYREDTTLQNALRLGRPVKHADVREIDDWVQVEGAEWVRAHISLPIMYNQDVIGVVNIDSVQPDAFRNVDEQRLQAFADQVSIAIRNARQATELEQRVVERTNELDFERRRLQSILDATGEGIVTSQNGRIKYANDMFCEMVGYSLEELRTMSTFDLVYIDPDENEDDEHIQELWRQATQALANGNIVRDEIRFRHKGGYILQAAITSAGIHNNSDRSGRETVSIIRDISLEKALDAQKKQFISSASHELRGPITSLNTRIYMLQRKPEELAHHVAQLERIADHLSRLVADMLDIGRLQSGRLPLKRREVILQKLMPDVVDTYSALAQREGINFVYKETDQPLHVSVDPDRILQVLTNLISNAIKYTYQIGTVGVELACMTDASGITRAHISVIDTGTGIPQTELEQIFQPFHRLATDSEGTGLGLSIAREIVQMHGGEIMVESVLGQGSTFTVMLPMTDSYDQ